jgi:hypothetical protein
MCNAFKLINDNNKDNKNEKSDFKIDIDEIIQYIKDKSKPPNLPIDL